MAARTSGGGSMSVWSICPSSEPEMLPSPLASISTKISDTRNPRSLIRESSLRSTAETPRVSKATTWRAAMIESSSSRLYSASSGAILSSFILTRALRKASGRRRRCRPSLSCAEVIRETFATSSSRKKSTRRLSCRTVSTCRMMPPICLSKLSASIGSSIIAKPSATSFILRSPSPDRSMKRTMADTCVSVNGGRFDFSQSLRRPFLSSHNVILSSVAERDSPLTSSNHASGVMPTFWSAAWSAFICVRPFRKICDDALARLTFRNAPSSSMISRTPSPLLSRNSISFSRSSSDSWFAPSSRFWITFRSCSRIVAACKVASCFSLRAARRKACTASLRWTAPSWFGSR
mmetsp:Transcript_66245/g.182876  ORF Transcript_66245/g.182876 Transcript_66245/m.182876 type:complete len:349 (-) Transcript_66245:746-1792(-)